MCGGIFRQVKLQQGVVGQPRHLEQEGRLEVDDSLQDCVSLREEEGPERSLATRHVLFMRFAHPRTSSAWPWIFTLAAATSATWYRTIPM